MDHKEFYKANVSCTRSWHMTDAVISHKWGSHTDSVLTVCKYWLGCAGDKKMPVRCLWDAHKNYTDWNSNIQAACVERTLITSTSITGSSHEAQGLERFKKKNLYITPMSHPLHPLLTLYVYCASVPMTCLLQDACRKKYAWIFLL